MGMDDFDDSDDGESADDHSDARFHLREGLRGLADLLRALDEVSDSRGSGHVQGRQADVDFDVSVQSLGSGDRGDHSRKRTVRSSDTVDSSDDYLVTAREESDGIVVIADLPGVDPDDLSIGLTDDEETFVVGVDDEVIEQVSLPWKGRATDHSFSNGVLEVHVEEDA